MKYNVISRRRRSVNGYTDCYYFLAGHIIFFFFLLLLFNHITGGDELKTTGFYSWAINRRTGRIAHSARTGGNRPRDPGGTEGGVGAFNRINTSFTSVRD